MKLKRGFLLVISVFLFSCDSNAQDILTFEFMSGLPYNIPLPLSISQRDRSVIKVTAEYDSEPFKIPIFWIWRIGYGNNKYAWELEAVHHKLFLRNKPSEVSEYSVSHGLNIITINRAFKFDKFYLRTGAGIIMAHPENTVRGKKLSEESGLFNMGYYLTGPAMLVSVSKNLAISGELSAVLELKLAGGFAEVPVEEGDSDLFLLSFILSFGFGYDIEL